MIIRPTCTKALLGFLAMTMTTDAISQRPSYPSTRKDATVVDDLWGTKVADPYRWLENDTTDETAAWVKAQNVVTDAWLEKIPYRKDLAERYEELYNFPKVGAPYKVGDLFFVSSHTRTSFSWASPRVW